jgi:HSP20 family protein
MKTIVRHKRPHFQTLPNAFDELFQDWTQGSLAKSKSVSVNVIENENEYKIEVVAPGFSKSDFSIDLDNNMLTISTVKKEHKEELEPKYTRREYRFDAFKRSFELPENTVEAENISAKYDAGILKITLPKKEEVKPQPIKKIDIA